MRSEQNPWEPRSLQLHCPSSPPSHRSLIISSAKISADVLRKAQSPSARRTGGATALLSNSPTNGRACPSPLVVFLGLQSDQSLELSPLRFLTPAACRGGGRERKALCWLWSEASECPSSAGAGDEHCMQMSAELSHSYSFNKKVLWKCRFVPLLASINT